MQPAELNHKKSTAVYLIIASHRLAAVIGCILLVLLISVFVLTVSSALGWVVGYFADVAKTRGCAFLDSECVAELNKIDCMHLTAKGHRQLAEKLAELVPTLL